MDWKPAKICVAILVSHELFMIAMAASELDETNGEDRGARGVYATNARVLSEFGHGSTISH